MFAKFFFFISCFALLFMVKQILKQDTMYKKAIIILCDAEPNFNMAANLFSSVTFPRIKLLFIVNSKMHAANYEK